jgi:hypothetical protein
LFYDTQRPHNSLNNQEPMKTVVNYLKKSNRYGTHTDAWRLYRRFDKLIINQ